MPLPIARPRRRFAGSIFVALGALAWVGACGSRSALLDDLGPREEIPLQDATTLDVVDATPLPDGAETSTDAARDAEQDGPEDAGADAFDAPFVPGDGAVDQRDCRPEARGYIYALGESGRMYGFEPETGTVVPLATPVCPDAVGTPFSMAVDRQGIAYVEFAAGRLLLQTSGLFQINPRTGACVATPFTLTEPGWRTFGMGFTSDVGGPEETLWVVKNRTDAALAKIATTTFTFTAGPAIAGGNSQGGELTGSPDGRLFNYGSTSSDAWIVSEYDKFTGKVLSEVRLPNIPQNSSSAIARFGGAFYLFNDSTVRRYDPAAPGAPVATTWATFPERVVGAGVSTCAPP